MSSDLLDYLGTQRSRLVRMLGELVEIESHSTSPAGVARVAARLREELEPLGFRFTECPAQTVTPDLEWVAELMAPGIPYESLGSTYVAARPGEAGDRALLLGDLDTAFPVGTLAEFPFRIAEGRAYGPGVADMKGGLVVMVGALQALEAIGELAPVTIVLSGDEQAGSLSSRHVIAREASNAHWCLCVECARRGGHLMAARGHIGVGRIVARGRAAHAGSAHSEGINALDALTRAIPSVNQLTDFDAGVFVTVTIVQAGSRRSVIPDEAIAVLDIRTPSPGAWDAVTETLHRLLDTIDREHPAALELSVYAHRPGVPWNERLLAIAAEAGRAVGVPVEAMRSAAAGSSAFAAELGVPTLDGMGPAGGDLMTSGEYVDLETLVPRAALLAETIRRLAGRTALNREEDERPRHGRAS